MTDKKALGRGLSSLLPRKVDIAPQVPPAEPAPSSDTVAKVSLERIDPNPSQPRNEFEPIAMQELADSIRAHGVIQPLVVRRKGERFEIIAGERRWRAARMAKLTEVPVAILDLADTQVLEVALIENIQRADLNPIEIGQALHRLQESGMSHDALALSTGKDRSTITNLLRLLKLPVDVQNLIAECHLSLGHAKVVAGLPSDSMQSEVSQLIVNKGLSVRAAETLVKKMVQPPISSGDGPEPAAPIDANEKAAIGELERVLGSRVRIVHRGSKGGKIEIDYWSAEDLDRIYEMIVGKN